MTHSISNYQEPTREHNLPEFINLPDQVADEKTSRPCLCELTTDSNKLTQRVANNPNTPPEVLQKLADSNDISIRSLVAANPNTPTEVLLNLCGVFPEQVLNNPILSLLFLENPNLFDAIPIDSVFILLKQENVPIFFLEWAVNQPQPEVHLAVAMNAQTPRKLLEKFVSSLWSQVAEAAQLHVNWAGEMDEGWDEAAREAIQSIDILQKDWVHLKKLAKIGLIPEFAIKPLLRNLPKNEFYGQKVFKAAAESVNTIPSILAQLARHKNWEIRSAVACNLSTPADILALLASDRDWLVREAVAYNPSTPINILVLLASDRDCLVRKAVSYNPSTPTPLREQLIQAQPSSVPCNLIHHNLSTHQTLSTNPKTVANLFLEMIQKSQ